MPRRSTRNRRPTPLSHLAELESLRGRFGSDVADRRLELLQSLAGARLPDAEAVWRLHEILCYLRVYPDDVEIRTRVDAMLDGFDRRPDLQRFARKLTDTGIAGTTLHYSFYADTALWLSRRCPGALHVDWKEFEKGELLLSRLDLLATWSETPGLDEADFAIEEWVRRLAGPHTTDAEFLVQRAAHIGRTGRERDVFYEEMDIPLALKPTKKTPSRSRARLPGRPVHFQRAPLDRRRPDLKQAMKERAEVRDCTPAEGRRIVALAREAMVLRHRDLDAFAYGDPRDVRLFSFDDGLEFAVIGMKPERRLMVEAVYAYLTLKNGIPIGYVLTSALFGSSEIAYNVFDTWRGGEAAKVYGRVLAVTNQLYGSDTFTIYPYQLGGGGNTEGLQSGSWWFYQKLGFRARDPEVLSTMRRELAKMKKDPGHRTPIGVLAEIAEHNVYWSKGRQRDDVIGLFPLGNIGLRITDYLAERFGADRERGERICAAEAAKLCGIGKRRRSAGERLWWRRWAPLILLLPGIESWTAAEKRALVDVVHKKGSRRESDYAVAMDGHRKLRAALRRLARPLT